MAKRRRKAPRKAKSTNRDTTKLDLYAIDAHGDLGRPWIMVEMDSFSRARSIKISKEEPR
jgi:hypothetical protein